MKISQAVGAYSEQEASAYNHAQKSALQSTDDNPTLFLQSFLKKYGKGAETLVDVGSGARLEYQKLWAETVGGNVWIRGFEPSPHMRKIAQHALDRDWNTRVTLSAGDWCSLPVSSEKADIVVGRFSLHHVEDLELAYFEIARVLKYRGKAAFAVPHPQFCESELCRKGIAPASPMLMEASVFGAPVRYYYHSMADYLESKTFLKYFKTLEVREDDWTLTGGAKPASINALLFAIEKIV